MALGASITYGGTFNYSFSHSATVSLCQTNNSPPRLRHPPVQPSAPPENGRQYSQLTPQAEGSTSGNGYRSPLRQALAKTYRNPINMVGTRRNGDMRDNDVEGWPGYRIDEVRAKANARDCAPYYRPNIVLVNAGTNDALQSYDVGAAGERMERLVRDLWAASPNAVVVLSTLLMNRAPEAQRNVVEINAQYRALVGKLGKEGRKIQLAEMQGEKGPQGEDLPDGTHPNDKGYAKMAEVWFEALRTVGERSRWVVAPDPVPGLGDDGGS